MSMDVPVPRGAAVAVGLLIAGALALVDALFFPNVVVISTVLVAPFVVSLLAGWREAALVAAVAFGLTLASGAWNHNFGSGGYWLRAVVVMVGGVVAVVAAGARERIIADRLRFALLADVAGVADGRLSLEQTAERVTELIVPAIAEVGIVDVVHEAGLRRLAVKAAGADAPGREARLRDGLPKEGPFPDARTIVVPLTARGRELGALTLMLTEHPGQRFTSEDRRFAAVLAGRVALALDNAGLFTELQTTEAQLTTALGTLAEAVTVQSAQGGLIYANQAAADVLGYASPQELVATPPEEIAGQYSAFREDGSPLQPGDLPGRRVADGELPEALVLRVVDRRTGEQRWRRTKSTAVRDSDGAVKLVVNVIADITAVKRAELLQRLLAAAGAVLAASEDLHLTLQQIADICVPDLADWCAVSMPSEHNQLRAVAVAHVDREKVALAQSLGERYPVDLDEPGGGPQVFREGRPLLIRSVTDEMLVSAARDEEHLTVLRRLGMRAGLIVPMTTLRGTVGVLTLASAESGRMFGEEDVTLASELARQAATAVENARLYTERSRIARTLQESLLPDKLPAVPGFRTASLYRPAGDQDRVGGDFYEAFRLGDDAWMLMIGDVTGRGAPAAALTGLMRHTLRAIATYTGSATEALHQLNQELVSRPQTSLCTAVCVVLRATAGQAYADIICAGHPLPIVVRDGGAAYVGEFGPMLGAFGDARWRPTRVPLSSRDVLVLYSDGVLDAAGAAERFGPERLRTTLAGADGAGDAVARLEGELAGFEVGAQADDTAILAIERLAVAETTRSGEPTDGLRA